MQKPLSITIFTISTLLFIFATQAHAGLVPCGGTGQEECTLCHLFLTVQKYLNGLLFLLAGLTLFVSIITGYMFFFASAKPEALATAKKALTSAFVGFFLVLVAWLIVFSISKIADWKEETGGKWWEIHCEVD